MHSRLSLSYHKNDNYHSMILHKNNIEVGSYNLVQIDVCHCLNVLSLHKGMLRTSTNVYDLTAIGYLYFGTTGPFNSVLYNSIFLLVDNQVASLECLPVGVHQSQ